MQRIGVFVCHCGTNIAGTVDVKAVAAALQQEAGVVFSTEYPYMCSQAGQSMIVEAVHEHQLTGLVICSCSPRMHEATFRKTAAAAVRRRGSGCGNLLQRKACRRPSRRVSFFFSGSYAVSQNGRERACRQGAR